MATSPDSPAIVSLHRRRSSAQAPAPCATKRAECPGLRYRLPTSYPRDAPVDLSTLSRPILAEQVAMVIWADHHDDVAFRSFGAIGMAVECIRRFDDFLAAKDPEQRIRSLQDIQARDIDAFDIWAHQHWPRGASAPYSHLTSLVHLLSCAQEHRFTSPELAPRLEFVSRINRPVATTPRDAYSPFVMEQMRAGARASIRRTVLRMAQARRVPAPSAPSELEPTAAGYIRHMRHIGFLPGLVDLPPFKGNGGAPDTYDQVYPRIADLVPFALLIADDCGLPPESIRELEADCLDIAERDFGLGFVRYMKRRRGVGPFLEPVRTKQRWSTGWLVGLLLALTATARAQMPEGDEKRRLFVGRSRWELKHLWLAPEAVSEHLKRFPIQMDDGTPLQTINLARIRKTRKAARYLENGGDLSKIGDDHSRATFGKYYGAIASLADTHEGIVAHALADGLNAALRTTILLHDDERQLRADPAAIARRLGRPDEKVRGVADGSSDVWLAGCLDFENSPYPSLDGTRACGAPLWGCLDCRNAVITPSKLPALLRLLGHICRKRQEMSLEAFEAAFGLAFVRIQQILARFPAAALQAALDELGDDLGGSWSPAQLTYKV